MRIFKGCDVFGEGYECQTYDPCFFDHLENGILATSSGSNLPVEIIEAVFSYNEVACRLEGLNNAYVYLNEIQINRLPGSNSCTGIFLEEVTNFDIQENNIYFGGGSEFCLDGGITYRGIVLSNNGDQNKSIYRNSITGMNVGVYVRGDNGGLNEFMIPEGIQLICNDIEKESQIFSSDIELVSWSPNGELVQTTLSRDQGSFLGGGIPAGNTLSDNSLGESHFKVNLDNTEQGAFINYFSRDINEELLVDFTEARITQDQLSVNGDVCPVFVYPETIYNYELPNGFDGTVSELTNDNDELQSTINVYRGNLDTFEEQDLKVIVQDLTNSSSVIRNALLATAPKISDETWKLVFTREPEVDPWHVSQGLIACNPLSKHTLYMMNHYGFDPFYAELVQSTQNGGISSEVIFQNEIQNMGLSIQNTLNNFARTLYMNDGLNPSSAAYLDVLKNNPNWDLTSLILASIDAGDLDSNSDIFEEWSGRLSSSDQRAFILEMRLNINQQLQDCPQLREAQKEDLINIIQSHSLGSAWAKSLLMKYANEYSGYFPIVFQENQNRAPQDSELGIYELNEGQSIIEIRPNPSNGESIVRINAPEELIGNLSIKNQQGQSILELKNIRGGDYIDLVNEEVTSGMYFCTFTSNGVVLDSQKWIVR